MSATETEEKSATKTAVRVGYLAARASGIGPGWFVAGIVAIVLLLLLGLIVVVSVIKSKEPDCGPAASAGGLTIGGTAMDAEQTDIATQIIAEVDARAATMPQGETPAATEKATIIALIAGIVESGLHNVKGGDLDSAGIFQMRPGQGWGTYAQVTDPTYAINKFLDVMMLVPSWSNLPYGNVAQAVERSAFPSKYATHITEAEAINAQLRGGAGTPTTTCSGGSEFDIKLGQAVTAALAFVGLTYQWGNPPDGAGFIQAAFAQAGITLPGNITKLANYPGDASTGIGASWISASQLESGEATVNRGDLLFWSSKHGATSPDDATRAGLALSSGSGGGASLKVATWNLETGDGYQSRVDKAIELIQANDLDIVGFQEIEHPEIYDALKVALNRIGYAIYPDPSGRVYRNGLAARPIAFNTAKLQLLPGSGEVTYNRMADPDQPAHAPVIRLRYTNDQGDTQDIVVMNTHNPAYGENPPAKAGNFSGPYQRAEAAKQYAAKIAELQPEGLPIIFTGDFNESHSVYGNQGTWEHKAENLAVCRLLTVGMVDALDTFNHVGGFCDGTNHSVGGVIDHIYVSQDVQVENVYTITGTLSDHDARAAVVSIPGVTAAPQSADAESIGMYVGPKPGSGVIAIQPIQSAGFLGALRLSQAAVIGASGPWVNPLGTAPYSITDTYGWGNSSVRGYSFHDGTDLGATTGTPVYAAHSGTVWQATFGSASGNQIIIDNDGGFGSGSGTKYEHLSAMTVSASQTVVAGQLIGYVGETGNAQGAHLHFSVCTEITMCIRGSGAAGQGTVDPQPFMEQNGAPL